MRRSDTLMFSAIRRWTLPLLLVAALLAVGVLSAGCWRRDVSKAGSKIRLRIWVWGDIHETNLLTQAAKRFELDHPNVEVKVENTTGSGQKYITSLAGGNAGDVLQVHYSSLAVFADLGQLLPLEDFIKADAERGDPVGMEDFYPIGLKAYMFNGKLYGLPQKGSTVTMYYNKNLFDEAGLSYPDYNWTFDDFLHAAKKLTRDTDGDGRIDQIGCLPYTVYTWLWASGGAILSEDGRRVRLMEPNSLKGLQFFIDLRNRYHVTPRQMSIEGTDKTALTVFDGGRVGMEISGPWRLPRYCHIKDFAWDVAPLPKGPAGRGARYAGVCFSVWKGTKHPKLAWQLLRHMVSAKSQRLLAEAGSDVPSRRSVAETAFLHDTRIKADKLVFLEQLTHAPRLVPSTPLLGRILIIFNGQFELAMVGKSDLKSAMVDAKRQIEALIRQYKTRRAQR